MLEIIPMLSLPHLSPGFRNLHASTLLAAGFTDPIQGVRDFTQAIFRPATTTVLASAIAAIVFGGVSAWGAGAAYRNIAGSSKLSADAWQLLAVCIAIDAAGSGTFVLPGGEADDVLWAPASAFLLYSLFESEAIAVVNLVKEALPFTDILPAASIAWLLRYGFPDSPVSRALGIKSTTSSQRAGEPGDSDDNELGRGLDETRW